MRLVLRHRRGHAPPVEYDGDLARLAGQHGLRAVERRRRLVDVEELEVHLLPGHPEPLEGVPGVRDHPERPAQPDVVDRRERHQGGQQPAQAIALEPTGEQLDVAGFAREDVDEVEATAVPVLQVRQLLGEHHRRRRAVAVEQGQPGVGVRQHGRGDRHHRRDPRTRGDAQVPTAVRRRAEAAAWGLHVDPVTRSHLVDQPLREPTARDHPYADARSLTHSGADRVVASVVLAVDDPTQGQGLPRLEVVRRTQLVGHVEGHRDRVVAQALHLSDGQRVEGAAGGALPHAGRARRGRDHQISFTCSNGSRQEVQRYIALHAVGPNSEVSSTSLDPHRGQVSGAPGRQQVEHHRPLVTGHGAGRGDAVLDQRPAAALGDPVARPGRGSG